MENHYNMFKKKAYHDNEPELNVTKIKEKIK